MRSGTPAALSPADATAAAAVSVPVPQPASQGSTRRIGLVVITAAAVILAWDLIVRLFAIPPYIIPAPWQVARTLVIQRGMLWTNAVPTIYESVAGFMVGNVIAIGTAIVFVHSKTIQQAVYPMAVAIRTLPIVAISPILVLMLGTGYGSKIAIAALITYFPTLVNMVEGLQAVDPSSLELMHVLSASKTEVFRKVRWPSSLPYLFSALRIAATSSVLGAIVAEWIGTNRGLGYLIVLTTFDFRTSLLYASMVVASAIALGFFFLIGLLERLLVRWER